MYGYPSPYPVEQTYFHMKKSITLATATAVLALTAGLSQAATFINPTSVTSSTAGTDLRAASNLANGVGLDALDPPTHDVGNFTTSWVTTNPNVTGDYFGTTPITLTIDLGSDIAFTDFVTWPYGGGTGNNSFKQGNNVKGFSLQFATDAEGIGAFGTSIALNPSFVQPESAIFAGNNLVRSAPELYSLGQEVTARYIEMTVTDNYFGEAGFAGGDRVGLGAVAVAIPEPSSTALIGLAGLGLLVRRRG